MAENWYVQNGDGSIMGPFAEKQISTDLLANKIVDGQQVRQGEDGPWCEAERARAVFRQLAEVGWYIRAGEEQFGPFTDAKLLELHRTGELAADAEVRQGIVGIWKPAGSLLSLWQNQKVSDTASGNGDTTAQGAEFKKWSVEPIRQVAMKLNGENLAAKISPCSFLERLLLVSDPNSDCIRVTRTNGDLIGHLGKENSKQLVANSQRGVSHIALLNSTIDDAKTQPTVAIILCPPGATAEACRAFVDQNYHQKHTAVG